MDPELTFKISSLFALLILAFVGAILPIFLSYRIESTRGRLLMSLANCFAGGVFLSAGLLHLLPEGEEALGETNYPFAGLIASSTFCFILILERVAFSNAHTRFEAPHCDHHTNDKDLKQPLISHTATSISSNINENNQNQKILLPILLMVVLSIHSLFEGMAIGAAVTLAKSGVVFTAVVAHKGVAAFALGTFFVRDKMHKHQYGLTITLITIFSLSSPLGIIIGIGLNEMTTGSMFSGICMALGAGTFFYVAFIETIAEEFGHNVGKEKKSNLWCKAISLCIGITVMALIGIHDDDIDN